MIKSTLILILGLALVLATLVTRPSELSARTFLGTGRQPVAGGPKTLGETVKDVLIKSAESTEAKVPEGYEFKDRVLWVEVQKDGHTVYTGVLSHWFEHAPATPASSSPAVEPKIASLGK